MENEGMSKHVKRRDRKVDSKRRILTVKEEEALIVALKDAVAVCWKCENGFRTGYLGILERHMLTTFPGTDIRVDPHIHSKIHVWKKNHASQVSMMSRSGFGWNESTNMIIVEDSIWDTYVKSFPLYPLWCEIFGKDRAAGEHTEDCNDAADELQKNDNTEAGEYVPNGFDTNFQIFGDDEEFIIGYEYDVSEVCKAVYEALGRLPNVTMTQKIWVAKRSVNNGKDMDLFFSLLNEARAEMVRMMLDGAY
ncbi:hypothetical protein CDL12_16310 [Handroanthus impetiginosus]|uniref:Myb/SANT-like domain-containing protein n=1 Tax=Handroanthus impetiginosus TaxID=429701 RepID=A0A2G9H0P1_9LAMI|nr:hypothetical protein CDL12_16310 [Handroanthus impetiginosus]